MAAARPSTDVDSKNPKGRIWIIENLKFEPDSRAWTEFEYSRLYFDSQLQAHVYESPTWVTVDTVRCHLQPSSLGHTRLAPNPGSIKYKPMIRLDFKRDSLVPFKARHDFICTMLKIEPNLTIRFESTAEMEGMIVTTSETNGRRSPCYYFCETLKDCWNTYIRRAFQLAGMTLTLIPHPQHKMVKDRLLRRNKTRVCWMFCPARNLIDRDELMERLPHPLLGYFVLEDNRCVFRTYMANELVVPHLLQNGLIEKSYEKLCLKVSLKDVNNTLLIYTDCDVVIGFSLCTAFRQLKTRPTEEK
nr:MAG: hypothetical protein [Hemigrapsus takanoi nimavirus]